MTLPGSVAAPTWTQPLAVCRIKKTPGGHVTFGLQKMQHKSTPEGQVSVEMMSTEAALVGQDV